MPFRLVPSTVTLNDLEPTKLVFLGIYRGFCQIWQLVTPSTMGIGMYSPQQNVVHRI